MDDIGDHHVADIGVQGRRLAQHVDAAQRVGRLADLAQDVVRGEAERIVDVDDHRAAGAQARRVEVLQPRVEHLRVQPVERDHLGRHAQRGAAGQVRDADRVLVAAALDPRGRVLRLGLEEQPRAEVQEVLPRALRPPGRELRQLLAQVVGALALQPRDDLALAQAGGAGQQVHERVRVRRDEVERPVGEALLAQRGEHGLPPAPRHPRVADLAAAEDADAQLELAAADLLDERAEAAGPRLADAHPVGERAAQRLRAPAGVDLVRRVGRRGEAVQLVELDLVGDEGGDQVVEVRARRDQHGERAGAVVVPAPPAGRRLDGLPVVQGAEAVAGERRRLLTHDDELRAPHAGREPVGGVQEGAEVELLGVGAGVQARAHRAVRGLEDAQERLARRPQQRAVGAVVELDLVGELLRLPHPEGRVGEAEAGDGHAANSRRGRTGSHREAVQRMLRWRRATRAWLARLARAASATRTGTGRRSARRRRDRRTPRGWR